VERLWKTPERKQKKKLQKIMKILTILEKNKRIPKRKGEM